MTALDPAAIVAGASPVEFTYNDTSHVYMANGTRQRSFTAIAKIVADSYNVEQWAKRQVALGLALDQTLVEDVAAHRDDDTRLNDIVERAVQVAGADRASRRGTQGHAATEYHDLGQPLITAQQQRDADRWARTLDAYGLVADRRFIERIVWYPADDVCGRTDRWLWWGDELVNLDIKHGFGAMRYPHSTAVQLALQVNGPIFAAETAFSGGVERVTRWEWTPSNLRRDIAFIAYLSPDTDEIGTLYRFDLTNGDPSPVEMMRASIRARHWQRRGDDIWQRVNPQLRPAPRSDAPAPLTESNVVDILAHRQQVLVERIMGLADVDRNALRADWANSSLPPISQQLSAAELEVAEQLVDAHDPFMVVTPSPEVEPSSIISIERPPTFEVDEVALAATADVLETSAKYAKAPTDVIGRINAIQTEALQHHVSFHVQERPTLRRLMIVDTLIYLSAHDSLDDESLRMLTTLATGDQSRLNAHPLGWCVGAMSTDHAIEFARLAGQFVRGQLVVRFTDDGQLVVDPSTHNTENN